MYLDSLIFADIANSLDPDVWLQKHGNVTINVKTPRENVHIEDKYFLYPGIATASNTKSTIKVVQYIS